MNLIGEIKQDLRNAILNKDTIRRNILRVVIGELERRDYQVEVKTIIKKTMQSNLQTLALIDKNHPQYSILVRENEILDGYLPETLPIPAIKSLLFMVQRDIRRASSEGQAIGIAIRYLKEKHVNFEPEIVKLAVQQIRDFR